MSCGRNPVLVLQHAAQPDQRRVGIGGDTQAPPAQPRRLVDVAIGAHPQHGVPKTAEREDRQADLAVVAGRDRHDVVGQRQLGDVERRAAYDLGEQLGRRRKRRSSASPCAAASAGSFRARSARRR